MLISLIIMMLMRTRLFRQALAAVLLTGCLLLTSCAGERFRTERQVTTSRTDAYTQFVSYSKIAPEEGSRWTASVDSFNSRVEGWLLHLTDSLKAEADTLQHYFELDSLPRPVWICQFYATDTVLRADPDCISLRLDMYTCMGTAKGQTSSKTFNYDVRHSRFLSDSIPEK